MIRGVLPLVALTAIMVSATPAAAQGVCAERNSLVTKLQQDFSEAPSAAGISDSGAVIEVLSARDGKTWTILMTTPDGVSCVLATGEAWERAPGDQIVAGRRADA